MVRISAWVLLWRFLSGLPMARRRPRKRIRQRSDETYEEWLKRTAMGLLLVLSVAGCQVPPTINHAPPMWSLARVHMGGRTYYLPGTTTNVGFEAAPALTQDHINDLTALEDWMYHLLDTLKAMGARR